MKSKNWNRRDLLETMGLAAFGTAMAKEGWSTSSNHILPDYLRNLHYKKPAKPITCVVLGGGGRGNVYAAYAEKYPDELKIVGVAEPVLHRRERFSDRYEQSCVNLKEQSK